MRALQILPLTIALFGQSNRDKPADPDLTDEATGEADEASGAPEERNLREMLLGAMAEARAVDVAIVADAFRATHPDLTAESLQSAIDAFKAQKPALFAAADESERYIVEMTTVFELLGSTVTFRAGQIIAAASRDMDIARAHNVPLRPLAPIVR